MGRRTGKSKPKAVPQGGTAAPGGSLNPQPPGAPKRSGGGSTINHQLSTINCPAWLPAVLLALVTIVLFWPATRCEFVNLDDQNYLVDNSHVQAGLNWSSVKWAFYNTEQAAYWAPLMWLSHIIAFQMFGLEPWGHHLINVLLHAASTMLVFIVFRRMTGAAWRSLLLAALFGWHPLRVESVAWVTERKDTLSTCFWALTLWAYARYAQTSKIQSPTPKKFYWLALVFFACGLMSKPMLVTVPFVLLLLDWWPLGRFSIYELRITNFRTFVTRHSSLVIEKVPFFILAALASVVTVVAQKRGGAMVTLEKLSYAARTENALISYCRYLGKLFWPARLAVFYPRPDHWPLAEVWLAGGLLLGLTALFLMRRRRQPFLLVGWLWFIGTLAPVIGLTQAGEQAMADRFTYVPSIGVLIIVIWGACEATRNWRHRVAPLSATGSAAIVLCMVLTRQQLGYWQDSETLFRHALEVTQGNYVACKNLGDVFYYRGQLDEAISEFQAATQWKPDFAGAYNNLGAALYKKGQIDEAIEQFETALRLQSDYPEAHIGLGTALYTKGRVDEAIRQYQEALRLRPDDAELHCNLGNILLGKGRVDEAIGQYREALRLKPDYAEARDNLARALQEKPLIR